MKKILYLICLAFLIVTPNWLKACAIVQGIVTDSITGLPIEGAVVKATRNKQVNGSTTTDEQGFYKMEVLPGNRYTITATAGEYQLQAIGAKLKKKKTKTVNFLLIPNGGTISGGVTDSLSQPINGATVEIFQGPTLIATDTTDKRGGYSSPNLAVGSYTVVAAATGFQAGQQGAIVPKGSTTTATTADFTLRASPGAISGAVIHAVTLRPIESVLIEVFKGPNLIASTLTDRKGNYIISGLAPGRYNVETSTTYHQGKIVGAIVESGSTTTTNFALLSNPGAVSGTVTDGSILSPIAGALVEVFKGSTLIASILTDPTGDYTISGLAPDSYNVEASATNYQDKIVGAIVAAGSTITADFALSVNPGAVSGVVKDAVTLSPIAGALVEVFKGRALIASSLTDRSGNYTISGLAPDRYNVEASAANYQDKIVGASVSAGSITTTDFALSANPGAVSGTVTDGSTLSPIAGALVEVFKGPILVASALTDSTGNYTVSGLAPDNYNVEASVTDYQDKIVGAIVSVGSTTTADFALSANPGAVSGIVTDVFTLSPIAGALVEVFKGPILVTSALTDPTGDYTISGLAPDSYNVEASAANYQDKVVGASVSAGSTTTIDFALSVNPGAVSGTVTDGSTLSPIAGALVEVFKGPILVASALTDSTGNYTVSGLAPDNYNVEASVTDYQDKIVGAIVNAGSTTTTDFALSANPGSVSGVVTDGSTLSPIAGALVKVFKGPTLIASILTDPTGDYTISGLAPDSYNVEASAANYQDKIVGASVSAGSTTTADFSLSSSPGAISGAVTDTSTLSSIAGVLVEVFKGPILVTSALTDPAGNYTISGLAPGSYNVTLSAVNYQDKIVGAIVTAGATTTADFALSANPGAISGVVTDDSTLSPIAGALVEVFKGPTLIASALTDPTGNYTISGLAPDSYNVEARAVNYQDKIVGAIVTAGATTTADFSLSSSPGAISGAMTDGSTLSPIAGALVEVFKGPILIASALTDSRGDYTIFGLAPGGYNVEASAVNYQDKIVGAIVTAGATTTADFSLKPSPGAVSGAVTDDSTLSPIAGALVEVFKGPTLIASALTDPTGNYTISGLAPDSYNVEVSATDYQDKIVGASVSAGSTTTADFSLKPSPGAISGAVTDGSTLSPIAGALVEVFKGPILIASALTDSTGNYTVSGLAPDSYNVEASATDYQNKIVGATVTAGSTTTADFFLGLEPGAISGVVTDVSTLSPIAGALVEVFKGPTLIASALTDPMGNYTISGLAPDSYNVEASATNYQDKIVGAIVTAGATITVDFSLKPSPGAISGIVTDGSTLSPIAGALVEVFKGPIPIASALTDSTGNYTISGLAPDSYNVEASTANYQDKIVGAIVTAGATITVDFALSANPAVIVGTVTDATTLSPIAGALVEVFKGPALVAFALTDPTGNYTISRLAPDSYNVEAGSTNYQDQSVGMIATAGSTTTAAFALSANPATIAGVVREATTLSPIAGALVEVFKEPVLRVFVQTEEFKGPALITSALTDSSGNYIISGLAPDDYDLEVTATNYQDETVGAIVTAAEIKEIDVVLSSNPGAISGVVRDATTLSSIAGAFVEVFKGPTLIASALTDPSGNYTVSGLAPYSYNIEARAKNYQDKIVGAIVNAGSITTTNFALSANPGAISGVVREATTLSPIAGAFVEVFKGPILIASALTDPSGNYTISGLAPDSYNVEASATNYQDKTVGAIVTTAETKNIDFVLSTHPATIVGVVRDVITLSPIEGALVEMFKGSALIASALTDPSGSYTISGLVSDSYNVEARAKNYQEAIVGVIVTAAETKSVDFALNSNPAAISGIVRDAITLSPIAGALVEVFKGSILTASTLTDSSGKYNVSGLGLESHRDSSYNYLIFKLGSESYDIEVTAKNYKEAIVGATVIEGETTMVDAELIPDLLPPAQISGRVIKDRSLTQVDRVHAIKWQASPSPSVIGYQVIRNGVLIGFVPFDKPLEFLDYGRNGKKDEYSVVALDQLGQVSSPVMITLH